MHNSAKRLAAACVALLSLAVARADEVSVKTYRVAAGDKVTPQTWPWRLLTKIPDEWLNSPVAAHTAVVFTNSLKTIAVKYREEQIVGKDGVKQFAGHFGWTPPTCNWYHDGFFRVKFNGEEARRRRFELQQVESGARGLARFAADMRDGRIVVTFALLPRDDKLLLHLELQPAAGKKVESASVEFGCYPSDFAVHRPETRRRALLTARRELAPEDKGGSTVADLTDEEPWILFYDRHYDVAQGRGAGPCALACDLARTNVRVACGAYRCLTTAVFRPGVTETSFLLWDLSGVSNADAFEYMRGLRITPVEGGQR